MQPLPLKPGIHSIPAMHTTHKHIEAFYQPIGQTLVEAWEYTIGKIPPNYPVPATLLDCTINHEQWRVQQYLNNR